MLSNGPANLNGTSHISACDSDYPAVTIDASFKPRPRWRDELAPVTWSMSYCDLSGITHSVTLRGDTEEEVLEMVKPLVAGVRQAKEKAKHSSGDPETKPERPQDGDIQHCALHGVDMPRRWSKRTNGHYFGHKAPDGSFCYGKAKA